MSDKRSIPILDLRPEIELLWEPMQAAIANVLRGGQFILGPCVKAFESQVAEFLGVKHALGCNSGTDALVIALRALGIGPGHEVITTAFSFFATAEAISLVGAVPVFVDVEPRSLNLNADLVAAAITPRTRAILPVHLFGHAANMKRLLDIADRNKLYVLEDVAQAFGGRHEQAMLGALGHISAFSFFPSKNLGALGDGGLIATNNDQLADLARLLRAHGSKKKYQNEMLGYNSRLDELQAALLAVKLPHVKDWNERRRATANEYQRLLASVTGIELPSCEPYAHHVYHQYTIRVSGGRRNVVQQRLESAGIGTMVYYPLTIPDLPVYAGAHGLPHICAGTLAHARQAASEVLSLPMGPFLSPEAIERVAAEVRAAVTAI